MDGTKVGPPVVGPYLILYRRDGRTFLALEVFMSYGNVKRTVKRRYPRTGEIYTVRGIMGVR